MSRAILFLEEALKVAKKPEDVEWLVEMLFSLQKEDEVNE